MGEMAFNILKRAQDSTKVGNKLDAFFKEQGVDLKQVRKNPDYYEELIKQYSKACINEGLFEESRERMAYEFQRLCEFHRRNENDLVEKFYNMTRDMIKEQSEIDRIR